MILMMKEQALQCTIMENYNDEIQLKDIQTKQTSLEEIFVTIVKE